MYCRRCGKFIDGSLSVCNECVEEMLKNEQKATVTEKKQDEQKVQVLTVASDATEVAPVQQVVYQRSSAPKKENVGLTRAIWSVVLPVAAFVVFMFIVMQLSNVDVTDEYYNPSCIGFSIILFAFPECILGAIFGAKSIVTSNIIAKQTGVRPKATLICGIIGLALSCYLMTIFIITLELL